MRGELAGGSVGGALHDVGPVALQRVDGHLSAEQVAGPLAIQHVGGHATVQKVAGDLQLPSRQAAVGAMSWLRWSTA